MPNQYRKRPVVVTAISFDQLVEHGVKSGAHLHNGVPWSFTYNGHPITHETDECYLIPTPQGIVKMGPHDLLITGVKGEIYPCRLDVFVATYEPVDAEISGTEGIVAASPDRPLTTGERMVDLHSNPTNNPAVFQFKSGLAKLIDQLDQIERAMAGRVEAAHASNSISWLAASLPRALSAINHQE